MSLKSSENIKRLYETHKKRYSDMLERSKTMPGYRVGELITLLELWEEVKAKDFDYFQLSEAAANEVDDAIYDEIDSGILDEDEVDEWR